MLKLATVMIGSDNAERLIEFYTNVFGESHWAQGGFTGWKLGESFFMIGAHSEVHGQNDTPGRLILMLETPDVAGEFKRVSEAGAKVVAEPYHPGDDTEMWLSTLADSDGNYFQLVSPMKDM